MRKFDQAPAATQNTGGDEATPSTASNDAQATVQNVIGSVLDALRRTAQQIDEVMPGTIQEAGQSLRDTVAEVTRMAKQAVSKHTNGFINKATALFGKR